MAETHALNRTSPKGGPFLGTCTKCGMKDLPLSAVREECENPARLTFEETLAIAISPPDSSFKDETKPS